jgi:FMN-dependent NADH-azoreductase
LIDEIKASDEILITSPMYNFQISSSLKAYIDHIVRSNETFVYSNGEYRGLINNKKCHVITTMGGRKADVNQGEGCEIYLRNILGFIGISNTAMLCVDGTSDPKYVNSAIAKTRDRILNLI